MEAEKIIITGGATRVGAAIAKSLAAYEVNITVHYNKSKSLADELKKELDQLNLKLFVEKEYRLPMLNSIIIPEGKNDLEIRSRLLNEFNIEIGGGLGPLAGKIWRIGLMGETAKNESIQKLMDAFRIVLN